MIWGKWSDSLLTYIANAKRRNWKELIAWSKEEGMSESRLRNCLAWLRGHKRIECEGDNKDNVFWRLY